MTDEQIIELVLAFMDARGGYIAGAFERELFAMVKEAVEAERQRTIAAIQAIGDDYPADGGAAAAMARHIVARALAAIRLEESCL